MSTTTYQILQITAMLLSPLIAVQVTKYLERKREERNRKLEIFRFLMGQRGLMPRSDEFITILNQIQIVFHNHEPVLLAWRNFFEVTGSNHAELSDSGKYLIVLLQEMSKVLNISNLHTTDIDNYYAPQQRKDGLDFQREYGMEFLRLLKNSEHFGEKRKETE